jgi:hypothetical protein
MAHCTSGMVLRMGIPVENRAPTASEGEGRRRGGSGPDPGPGGAPTRQPANPQPGATGAGTSCSPTRQRAERVITYHRGPTRAAGGRTRCDGRWAMHDGHTTTTPNAMGDGSCAPLAAALAGDVLRTTAYTLCKLPGFWLLLLESGKRKAGKAARKTQVAVGVQGRTDRRRTGDPAAGGGRRSASGGSANGGGGGPPAHTR